MVFMYNGEGQKCWSLTNNPSWPTWCDVYVHWAQGKHWHFQGMKENEREWKSYKVLNNIIMVTLGHITFRPIIANLVCVHF